MIKILMCDKKKTVFRTRFSEVKKKKIVEIIINYFQLKQFLS